MPELSENGRATPQLASAVGTFFRVPKSYGVAFQTRTGNRVHTRHGSNQSVRGMITPTAMWGDKHPTPLWRLCETVPGEIV